jgi:hypothetical protein
MHDLRFSQRWLSIRTSGTWRGTIWYKSAYVTVYELFFTARWVPQTCVLIQYIHHTPHFEAVSSTCRLRAHHSQVTKGPLKMSSDRDQRLASAVTTLKLRNLWLTKVTAIFPRQILLRGVFRCVVYWFTHTHTHTHTSSPWMLYSFPKSGWKDNKDSCTKFFISLCPRGILGKLL